MVELYVPLFYIFQASCKCVVIFSQFSNKKERLKRKKECAHAAVGLFRHKPEAR